MNDLSPSVLSSSHLYIPQEPALQTVLCGVWQSDIPSLARNETILPKGVVEIIFDFGEQAPVTARLGDRPYALSRGIINGFNTSPIDLRHPGRHTYFGVQLQPVSVKKLLRIPPGEFSNVLTDLSLIDSGMESIWHQLAEKETFPERVAVVSEWLTKNVAPLSPQEKMLGQFLTGRDLPYKTVTELANALCYSPRHLSRKTYELTGMNAEDVLLYKKYLYSIQLMHGDEALLTEIAYRSGFADQSHFIRSFSAFTRRTPGEYRRNRSGLPGHLFENVR